MELHLIRHTKPDIDPNICYGQSDIPLADTFEQDLEEIKAKIDFDTDLVYSSPLSRCSILAERISTHPVIYDNRLKEISFGQWESKFWDELDQTIVQEWMKDYVNNAPPLGENLLGLYARVESFIMELLYSGEDQAVIVTHSGVIRSIFTHILENPIGNMVRFAIGFNEIHTVVINKQPKYNRIVRII